MKVVTVGTDGSVTDVSEDVRCRSTDEDVVKVSRGRRSCCMSHSKSYIALCGDPSLFDPKFPQSSVDLFRDLLRETAGFGCGLIFRTKTIEQPL